MNHTKPLHPVIKHYLSTCLVIVVIVAACATSLFSSSRAQAAGTTFVVNSTFDTVDATIDGTCDDGAGNCTLRGAIQEANTTAGTDPVIINFNIPGSDVQIIDLQGSLPISRPATVINGFTQPGSSEGDMWHGVQPVWNIRLESRHYDNGVMVSGSGSVIRGLWIVNTDVVLPPGDEDFGIFIENASNVTAQNNRIEGYRGVGILLRDTPNVVIEKNVIGNNGNEAIVAETDYAVIRDNFIGTLPDGITANGNLDYGGIAIRGSYNVVHHNLISGNLTDGIQFTYNSWSSPTPLLAPAHNTVTGNWIGLARDGSALGNAGSGILLKNADTTIIGGPNVSDRNVISNNNNNRDVLTEGAGIKIEKGVTNTTIQSNYIGLNATGTSEACNIWSSQVDNKGLRTKLIDNKIGTCRIRTYRASLTTTIVPRSRIPKGRERTESHKIEVVEGTVLRINRDVLKPPEGATIIWHGAPECVNDNPDCTIVITRPRHIRVVFR